MDGIKAPNFKTPGKGDTIVASAYYDNFTVTAVGTFDKITPTDFKWIIVSGNATGGFSGGPAFDKEGNLVGIMSNVNSAFTNLSSSENIKLVIQNMK